MNSPDQLIDDLRLLEPPEPFHWPVWWIAGAVLLVLLLAGFLRWWRSHRGARQQARTERRAWQDALAELERLFALVEQEESRPYATESSSIIRRYLEARFGLSAPRLSTEEFLAEAQTSPRLEASHQAALGEFLRVCDLLKFARTRATRPELLRQHEAAVKFVKETRQGLAEAAA